MFRFVSGVLAWIRALMATAASKEKEKDTSLVDWLESLREDSLAVLRWSTTGRGWRLHDWPREWLSDGPGTVRERCERNMTPACREAMLGGPGTVREAIREAMLSAAWDGGSAYDGLASKITDSQMLDWLDCLGGRYTGRVIWRRSTTRTGWILHETSRLGATPSVREAIGDAIRFEGSVGRLL